MQRSEASSVNTEELLNNLYADSRRNIARLTIAQALSGANAAVGYTQ